MTYQRTPGIPVVPPFDSLATGEMVPPRDQILASGNISTSQTMALCYFNAEKTETITTLTGYTGATAAAATPTLCRMGVYSIAANGDGTLIASTPNDTALFAATFTAYPKALSASFVKTAGQRYATALLIVSAAAMPTFIGPTPVAANPVSAINLLAPIRVGRIVSQSDLPSTFVVASVAGYHTRAAMLLS